MEIVLRFMCALMNQIRVTYYTLFTIQVELTLAGNHSSKNFTEVNSDKKTLDKNHIKIILTSKY